MNTEGSCSLIEIDTMVFSYTEMDDPFAKCLNSTSWGDFSSSLLYLLRRTMKQPFASSHGHFSAKEVLDGFDGLIRRHAQYPSPQAKSILSSLLHASLWVDKSERWRSSVNAIQLFRPKVADDEIIHYLKLRKAGFRHADAMYPHSWLAFRSLEEVLWREDATTEKEEDESVLISFKHRVGRLLEKGEPLKDLDFRILSMYPECFDPRKAHEARRLYCNNFMASAHRKTPGDRALDVGLTVFELDNPLSLFSGRLVQGALCAKLYLWPEKPGHPVFEALLNVGAQRIRVRINAGHPLDDGEFRMFQHLKSRFSGKTVTRAPRFSGSHVSPKTLRATNSLRGADLIISELLHCLRRSGEGA